MLAGCPVPTSKSTLKVRTPRPLKGTSTEVRIDDRIAGTFVQPASSSPYPTVLMLHGFGSSRDEVGNMFIDAAHALASEGIASLRIDFRGGGDSEGSFEDTTVDGQLEDTKRALKWLQENNAVDPSRIGLLGFSLGAAIAVLTAHQHNFEVHSMVLWSPMGDLSDDFLASLGQDTFDTANRAGRVKKDLGWRTVTLKRAFFDSLDNHDIKRALSSYNGPFLAIAGREDPLSQHAGSLAELVDGMTIFVEDADHIFHALSEDQTRADKVIQATIVRFTGTLKW